MPTITRSTTPLMLSLTTAALALLLGCSDGGVGSSGATSDVSFAVSDAPVGNLRSVTITIEALILNRPGDDIVIELFDTDAGQAERVTLDLLDYQGSESKLIVDGVELGEGTYQNLRLEIADASTDDSFVLEEDSDDRHELKVPSGELKLGGFEVEGGGVQTFVIEFDLLRAMTYNPGPDRYILKPRGVRVVDVETTAQVAGVATSELLDDCDAQTPDHRNRVYVYEGHGLLADDLGDAFDPDVDLTAPASTIAPFAGDTLDETNAYEIAFLPAGDYTLAFACDAAPDDAELFDGIEIPTPADQIVEISLEPGDEAMCDFDLGGPVCF